MTDSTPQLIYPYVLDGATSLVDAAYVRFTTFTNEAWTLAVDTLHDLADYTVPQLAFNAHFTPQLALASFPTIPAPTAPDITLNLPPSPTAPPVLDFAGISLDAPPTDNSVAPVFVQPVFPTLVSVSDPGTAPTLADVSLPTAPVLTLPDAPADMVLNLPVPPNLQLPTFQGDRPVFDAPIPTETFGFSPATYVSDLLSQTTANLSRMQQGGTGLPAAVAKALRDRATLAADDEVMRAEQETIEQYGARGFEEPSGILTKRLARVRADARAERAGTNRDIYIQDQQVAVENLRFSVQQGISLEGTLMQAFTSNQQMALDAAKYAVEMAISIFNARVSAFNAQVTMYQADAQVFRDLIAAESTKVELYRGLLEGEQIKAQISETQVRRYQAQLQGVQTLVDVYKSQLEAVTTEVAINAQKLDVFRTRVSVMTQQVQAQTTQIEGYTARINAEKGKAEFYSAATSAFAARVTAYRDVNTAKVDASRLLLENNKNRQEAWRDTVELYKTQIGAMQAQIDTIVKEFGMEADIYRSKATVATAASEANSRLFQLNLAEQQAVVDTSLKNAELQLKQLDTTAQIVSETKKAIAQVAGQLTAAAMSAVSFHAGTNYSGSMSLGYNLGISYSGTMP
ncbi:MAG: hypothetical protein V4641_05560 [Pseudomonadota bacterium]